MSYLSKAIRAYRLGGLSRVVRGGTNLLIKPIERQVIQRTNWKYPYYEWKYTNRAQRAMNKLSRKGIGPRIVDFPLEEYKTSDTLFIFGSGSSINDISDEMWKHIDKHDSIGLNRWPVHNYVPTYHVFEMKLNPNYEAYNQQYRALLESREEDYSEIPVILKNTSHLQDKLNPSHLPSWLDGKLIVSSDSGFSELVSLNDTVGENKKLLEYLLNQGFFDQGRLKTLYRKRGSISYLLHLGVVLGYDTIVLCGVDMINSDYFFDERAEYYERQGRPIPRHNSDEKDGEHKTNDTEFGQLTLEKVIRSMYRVVFEPNNINLFVENDISALHPHIPKYRRSQTD